MKNIETVDPHYGRLAALVDAKLIRNSLARNNVRIRFLSEPDPTVSIIIVSLNASDLLTLTLYRLASLQAFAGASHEVIIVDNASDSATQELLDRLDGVTIIRNARNSGYGPACNRGAAAARGRYLLFLNPNIELMPGALGALTEPFADAAVGIVGAHLVFPGGYLQECGAFFRNDTQVTHPYCRGNLNPFLPEGAFQRDVGYVSGAVMAIDKVLFDLLGGFDDIYAPAYFEDTDLCVRCHQAGRRVVYQPKASAIHFENATTSSRSEVETLIKRNREIFLDRHRSWLFPHSGAPPRFGDRTHDFWALKILFIDDAVPHIDLGAGLPRANFIITTMARLGYHVTVCPIYSCDPDIAQRYRDLPETVEILEAEEGKGLRRIMEDRRYYYDVLWVSRPHNINLVCEIFLNNDQSMREFFRSRIIFDSEAMFCLRDFLEGTLREGSGIAARLEGQIQRECSSYSQADHVVCVSEAEARLLREFGISNVQVLGHALIPRIDSIPSFDDRSGFLFIGSLEHPTSPNADSLIWFLDAVWPIVREIIPNSHFTIVGRIGSELRRRLAVPGVAVLGRVFDPQPLFDQARICVAPTRFAAGVPYKVHTAIAQGLPCMVTPILAEQIGWPKGAGYSVCDWRDARQFARILVDMHDDREIWNRLQRDGLEYVRRDCEPSAFAEQLRRLCEAPTFA